MLIIAIAGWVVRCVRRANLCRQHERSYAATAEQLTRNSLLSNCSETERLEQLSAGVISAVGAFGGIVYGC